VEIKKSPHKKTQRLAPVALTSSSSAIPENKNEQLRRGDTIKCPDCGAFIAIQKYEQHVLEARKGRIEKAETLVKPVKKKASKPGSNTLLPKGFRQCEFCQKKMRQERYQNHLKIEHHMFFDETANEYKPVGEADELPHKAQASKHHTKPIHSAPGVEPIMTICPYCQVHIKRVNLPKHIKNLHNRVIEGNPRFLSDSNSENRPDVETMHEDPHLYRCLVCNKYVLGIEKNKHVQQAHPHQAAYKKIEL
jgi:uncharacterized C2H2 Zn-finger protein